MLGWNCKLHSNSGLFGLNPGPDNSPQAANVNLDSRNPTSENALPASHVCLVSNQQGFMGVRKFILSQQKNHDKKIRKTKCIA